MHTLSEDFIKNITPEIAVQILKEGNERFVNNLEQNRNLLEQVNKAADGQTPYWATPGAAPSWVPATISSWGILLSNKYHGRLCHWRFIKSMSLLGIFVLIISCKKEALNPEKVSNLLLEQDESCRIVSYKWDTGTGIPWDVVQHYNGPHLDYYVTTWTDPWAGNLVSKKRTVTYNNAGNPDHVNNLVRFKYDEQSLLESVTTYEDPINPGTANEVNKVPQYKAYFKWKDGRIVSINECFYKTIMLSAFNYEYQELAPWSYSTFTYDSNGNIITRQVLDENKAWKYTISYQYDNSPNPLKNRFLLSGDYRAQTELLSKNNCTKKVVSYPGRDELSELTNSYQYGNNNYPLNGFLGDGQFIDIKYECK
ncbi:hypothetical protein [Dyadobacter sp. CY323]|uniref:hypothetical protein n=1 Tax=Dyadobacter sp. CY323 TaxID=2907302 RepID=UPI00286DA69C|nr:hypothetical protein [Dyadobacter sp. CY323]